MRHYLGAALVAAPFVGILVCGFIAIGLTGILTVLGLCSAIIGSIVLGFRLMESRP